MGEGGEKKLFPRRKELFHKLNSAGFDTVFIESLLDHFDKYAHARPNYQHLYIPSNKLEEKTMDQHLRVAIETQPKSRIHEFKYSKFQWDDFTESLHEVTTLITNSTNKYLGMEKNKRD
jgi:hypothetical protein